MDDEKDAAVPCRDEDKVILVADPEAEIPDGVRAGGRLVTAHIHPPRLRDVQQLLRPGGRVPPGPRPHEAARAGRQESQPACGADAHARPLQAHLADRGLHRTLPRHRPQLLQGGPCRLHLVLHLRADARETGGADDLRCLPAIYLPSVALGATGEDIG